MLCLFLIKCYFECKQAYPVISQQNKEIYKVNNFLLVLKSIRNLIGGRIDNMLFY